jgi:hypothetical protein
VAVTVIRKPLPKLQRFSTGAGSSEDHPTVAGAPGVAEI